MVIFRPRTNFKQCQGFSLIELLVAIAITGVISTAIFTTFFSQNKVYIEQEQVIAMQQNLRAGLDLMLREIRMAGFIGDGDADLVPGSNIGIVTADPDLIEFTKDEEEDGTLTEFTYTIYEDSENTPCLGRAIDDGSTQAIAEDIVGLGFAYAFVKDAADEEDEELAADAGENIFWATAVGGNWFNLDANGDGKISDADDTDNNGEIDAVDTGISVDLDNIRAVQIWLLARTGAEARGFTDNRKYIVGNKVIQPGNGYEIGDTGTDVPANTGYRYRLLNAIVYCRNLGL